MNKQEQLRTLEKAAFYALKKGLKDRAKEIRALMLKLILNKEL